MQNNLEKRLNDLEKSVHDLKSNNFSLNNEIKLIKEMFIKNNSLHSEKDFCPVCKNFSVFNSFGSPNRARALCPFCHSLERHRLVYFLFQKRFSWLLETQNINLLHFAPEYIFYEFFKKNENITYFPVDLNPELYKYEDIQKVNMENIPFEDEKFDFIYNCHVLEHVPDDIKAMSELYRVLKKDGFCIILVPQFNYEETLEKKEYNTPELRKKYYGQDDHVRAYGLDFSQRLESVGFNVETVTYKDIIDFSYEQQLYRLGGERIFICTK